MSARALAPGESGEFTVSPQCRDENGKWKVCGQGQGRGHKHERYRAQCHYRDRNGVRHPLSRVAETAGKAETKLTHALKDALNPNKAEGVIKPTTPFVDAGREWIDHIKRSDSGLAARSVEEYARTFRRYIDAPAPELKKILAEKNGHIRDLALAEANNTQRFLRFLQAVADVYGNSAAHHARSVISNIVKRAIRFNALTHNAMRDVGQVASQTPKAPKPGREPRDTSRALTRDERATLLTYADAKATELTVNPRTQRKWQTAADLLAFMAMTGCRVSEVRELRWEKVHLDLCDCEETGGPHAIVLGKGSKDRRVDFPPSLAARITRRLEVTGGTGYVFSAPALFDTEKVWDQSGCAKALSALIVGAGFSWATPHSLRRTVITLLHREGIPDVDVSDLAGHSDPNVTRRHYYGRKFMGARPTLAAALDV
ncbi:UNVERIFIED_ORG: hypothetical protein E4P37_07870 [Bacillus sp. AZ43]